MFSSDRVDRTKERMNKTMNGTKITMWLAANLLLYTHQNDREFEISVCYQHVVLHLLCSLPPELYLPGRSRTMTTDERKLGFEADFAFK